MSDYLLSISIGPVQGFIAAARRTRDFWMGSIILSEVSKAVARYLVDGPSGGGRGPLGGDIGRLIFPAPCKGMDLEPIPIDAITDRAPVERFSASNVLLCRVGDVPDDATAAAKHMRGIADEARNAANGRWKEFALKALATVEETNTPEIEQWLNGGPAPGFQYINEYMWRCQYERDDVVEFYAAWAREDGVGYEEARRRVVRLLAGRKALRDFPPWGCGAAGVPKSSLDGARESVRKREGSPLGRPVLARGGLRMKPDEELDLVGLTKRVHFGSNDVRFPSVSRFAVDPWVRGVLITARCERGVNDAWKKLIAACEELRQNEIAMERKARDRGLFPWLGDFRFEGTLLFPTRHKELAEEADDRNEAKEHLKAVASALGTLCDKKYGVDEPSPYLAILAADGDRMGRMLSAIKDARRHRDVSRCQSEFAAAVRDEIRKVFRGACAYAAADDVLAFLPVDQCIACANRLRRMFKDMVAEKLTKKEEDVFSDSMTAEERKSCGGVPTLSVGIAIGHFMEPLEDLLSYARQAEERAKNPEPEDKARGQQERNGLAVAIHARGGAPFTIRDNWGRGDMPPIIKRLTAWTDADREGALSAKAAYDLRGLAREYLAGESLWTPQNLEDALRREARRLVGRKRGSGDSGAELRASVRTIIDSEIHRPADLLTLAHELILGHWLAEAESLAAGGRKRAGGLG